MSIRGITRMILTGSRRLSANTVWLNPKEEFERAHVRFDHTTAHVLGLSTGQTDQIVAQMREDSFLKALQPAYAHRGLRVQPYSDRSGRDQYA